MSEPITTAATTLLSESSHLKLSDMIPALATSDEGSILQMSSDQAETLAGPFFGGSLLPYLAFLYFLQQSKSTPKGVFVGFTTLLLFVFLTIPAAIVAKLLYGVSLADSDWLHGSAESLLTITNLVTVIAFRQTLQAKQQDASAPASATTYAPMVALAAALIAAATATVVVPALQQPTVHTPYLGGFMDLPATDLFPEPDNALTVATWIIHISSLVEFLVAMGFCWRWADVVDNPRWKGLTWGLLPLHSSGITACTYHLFYNQVSVLVPLQALLTCLGNTTAAYAAYRLAVSEGWSVSELPIVSKWLGGTGLTDADAKTSQSDNDRVFERTAGISYPNERDSLVGLEDLGDALAADTDLSFLVKLFAGCAAASYLVKYGETWVHFDVHNVSLALFFIVVPSVLNAYKWYRRSRDPQFEGWF